MTGKLTMEIKADGILDFNSDNIKVPSAGNTITLDLSSPNYKYTLTKN
jgi:hypothetical protein